MAKRKKKGAARKLGKRHAAAAQLAKRIFDGLPHKSGPTYFDVLHKCGVPATVAKTIAGTWMLEHAQRPSA